MDRLASALRALGTERGDRVAYLGMNRPAFLEVVFATTSLGAVFVPVHARQPTDVARHIVRDAGVRVLIHGPEMAERASTLAAEVERVVAVGDDLETLIEGASPERVDEPVGLDDLALLAYTSGTTGLPKGAMLTHGNLTWNVMNMLGRIALGERDVSIAAAPLYRVGGLGVTVLETLYVGGSVVLVSDPRPEEVLRLVEEHRATTLFGAPDILAGLPQTPGWDAADISSLRVCVTGGTLVPEPLLRAFFDRGLPLLQGYGLSEASPVVTLIGEEDMLEKVGSAGRPVFFTDVRVAGQDLADVPAGEAGEILIRGPNVTSGYWNRPDATAASFTEDGWFRTGDAGRLDGDGHLYVVDRVRDGFVVAGHRVFPADVERVLLRHPAVADVAVTGVPDAELGEAPAAFAVLRGACTEEELVDLAAGVLPPELVPRVVRIVEEIPRNPSGKVRRAELRRLVEKG